MNILITGADSLLGQQFRKIVSDLPDNYVFTDKATLNICDDFAVRKMISTHKINVVINCTEYMGVEDTEKGCKLAFEINSIAVANLALATREAGIVFIQISSDRVSNLLGRKIPYNKCSGPSIIDVYQESKFVGEIAAQLNPKHMVIRMPNLHDNSEADFCKITLKPIDEQSDCSVAVDCINTPIYAGSLAAALLDILSSKDIAIQFGIYYCVQ